MTDSNSFLTIVTRYASQSLAFSPYALTYMDDHFYSLVFIISFIIISFTVVIYIPFKTIVLSFYTYRFSKSDSSSDTNQIPMEDRGHNDVVYSSSTVVQQSKIPDLRHSKMEYLCFEVLMGWLPAGFIGFFFLVLILFSSVFSRVHFVASAFLMSLVVFVWLTHSILLDCGVLVNGIGNGFTKGNRNPNEGKLSSVLRNWTMVYVKSMSSIPFVRRHPIVVSIIIFGFCLLAFIVFIPITYVSSDMCIAYDPNEISTRATRITFPDRCKQNTICFTYMTVPKDMSQEMIVNFQISSPFLTQATVLYGPFALR